MPKVQKKVLDVPTVAEAKAHLTEVCQTCVIQNSFTLNTKQVQELCKLKHITMRGVKGTPEGEKYEKVKKAFDSISWHYQQIYLKQEREDHFQASDKLLLEQINAPLKVK